MNKIINVKLGKVNTITITTDDLSIRTHNCFKLKHRGKVYYFKVFEIEADNNYNCKVKLNDIDYHNSISKENLQVLSELIDKEVEKITDSEEIRGIMLGI